MGDSGDVSLKPEGSVVTSDPATFETDSNNSLNEATEKTLKLDEGMDSSNPDDSNVSNDIRLSSPEKAAVDVERKAEQKAVQAKDEDGLVDVGGEIRHSYM